MKNTIAQVSLFAIGAMVAVSTSAHAQSWTGSYVALSAGSSKVSSHNNGLTFDTNQDGSYGDTVHTFTGADYFAPGFCAGAAQGQTPSAGCRKDSQKGDVGIRAGYDWQTGHLVYGALVDVTSLKLRDSVSGFSTAPDSYTFTRELKTLTAVRGRIGWGETKWLVYATAGFASADMDRSFATTNALNHFTALRTRTSNGLQLGVGGEWRFMRNWTVGVEYLGTSLRDNGPVILAQGSANTFASNPFLIANGEGTSIRRSDDRLKFGTVSVTVSYRFGAM
jgi:opacity protein-like surface antigen